MENMKVFYNSDYGLSPESYETTRKAASVKDYILKQGDAIDVVDPNTVINKKSVVKTVKQIHDPEYIKALETGVNKKWLHESSGFTWGERTFDFAVAHSHGIVAAVDTVIDGPNTRSGSLSSGLHHARPDTGAGLCTINGLAVGAMHTISRNRPVMILDFDAHCGGGTYAHIINMERSGFAKAGDIIQIDASVDRFDKYLPSGQHDLNLMDLLGEPRPDTEYLRGINKSLAIAESLYRDGMIVFYNAGIDPVNIVGFSNPYKAMSDREKAVSDWIGNKPAVFTLAGGYKWGGWTLDQLVEIHYDNILQWAEYCKSGNKAKVK